MRMIQPTGFFLLPVLLMIPVFGYGEKFEFLYTQDDSYTIISQVDEKEYINGRFDHRAEVINRIYVDVTDTKENAGLLHAKFIVSKRQWGSEHMYEADDEYESEYWRDNLGFCTVGQQYFMPVVRNVPLFPDEDLQKGSTWTAEGEEVHDLSVFGIGDAFHFPVTAEYTYLGAEELDGMSLHKIGIKYNIYYQINEVPSGIKLYPYLITGYSDQTLYWDSSRGRPYAYEEEFGLSFQFIDHSSYESFGTATAKVTDVKPLDRNKVVEEIEDSITEDEIPDTSVSIEEDGILLVLSNIQFKADSAQLLETETDKILKIADILKRIPGKDILITGHTALAGTAEGRLSLSLERARTVGNYFIALGVRDESQIIIRGMGAEKPIADNDTPEGRRLNRRVEIKILD